MATPYQSMTKPVTPKKLQPYQEQGMMICKQAALKSLIEAGAIKERNKQSEKLVMEWVDFVYRNGAAEWEALNQTKASPF